MFFALTLCWSITYDAFTMGLFPLVDDACGLNEWRHDLSVFSCSDDVNRGLHGEQKIWVLCSSGKRHCSWRENIKSIFITRISLGNTFQRKFCKCPTSLKCPTSMKSPTMSYISLKCPTSLSNVLHLSQMSYNVLHLSQMSYISLF